MITKTAYLHFGGAFTGLPQGPFQTVSVPCRGKLLPWQERGLQYTATGYGRKIPSVYQVQWNGRWQRVYICQYSNSLTAYIVSKGKPVATVSF